MTLFIFLEFTWWLLLRIMFIKYTKIQCYLEPFLIQWQEKEMAIQIITLMWQWTSSECWSFVKSSVATTRVFKLYSEIKWEAFLILNSFYWYFEGKIFQLAHSIPCLEKCLLQLRSQLLRGTGGFITGLSSPEFIRNKNLIELRQLSMQEQLPVADVLSPRRQVCLFDRTEGAWPAADPGLPCQVLLGACWVSPAPFSLSRLSAFYFWMRLFVFFLWQTASSTELVLLVCCDFYDVSGRLRLPVSLCHCCWGTGWPQPCCSPSLITLYHFLINIDPSWIAVSQFSAKPSPNP